MYEHFGALSNQFLIYMYVFMYAVYIIFSPQINDIPDENYFFASFLENTFFEQVDMILNDLFDQFGLNEGLLYIGLVIVLMNFH